jgi:hypothetical protein
MIGKRYIVVAGHKSSKKLKEEKLRQKGQKREGTSFTREVVREGRKDRHT